MEVLPSRQKYFITPSQNIVRGVVDGGKLVNAEFFVNKRNEYNNPTQLNQLMKERSNLSLGKVELKEVSRPNFNEFNIPIDAGKIRRVKKNDSTIDMNAGKKKRRSLHAGEVETTDIDKKNSLMYGGEVESTDIDAGKKRKPSSKKLKKKSDIVGGEVESTDIDAGKKRSKQKKAINAGEVETTVDAGKKKRRSLHAGEVETTDIDAGKKRRKSTSAKSSSGKKSKKSSKSRKASIVGGNPNDKKTSLADLFKQVSIHLANQTSDIIAKGGDPSELLKDDIKFFSKK
jgi:hypothetical protein